MTVAPTLATSLLRCLATRRTDAPALDERERDELEQLLHQLISAAQVAWPEVAVGADEFLASLAERMRTDCSLREALAELHASDLYLVVGCIQRDPRALALFEQTYGAEVELAARRMPRIHDLDDLNQIVLEKLIVGVKGAPPSMQRYAARGALRHWLRVVIARTLIDLARETDQAEVALRDDEQEPAAIPAVGVGLEIEYLRNKYAPEFKAAFEPAVAALSPRQRNLLRFHLLHRLTIDDIGALYRVHRATAARWIESARNELLLETKQRMMERLRSSPSEVDGILGVIRSQLDVSIQRILGPEEELSSDRTPSDEQPA